MSAKVSIASGPAVIQLHDADDVVVALRDIRSGETVTAAPVGTSAAGAVLHVAQDVARGHKIALRRLATGQVVHKYGASIGRAKTAIEPGEWVHTHNLETALAGLQTYDYRPAQLPASVSKTMDASPLYAAERTFAGYVRPDGQVGIRNEIWILNTVGCINKSCEALAHAAHAAFAGQVDGVYHFAHPFGCSQLGDDLRTTRDLLAALARHPNAGGVLVVGLGCENNQIDALRSAIGPDEGGRLRFMVMQDVQDEFAVGMAHIEQLVAQARSCRREPVPLSSLIIGLKCGGSDGFSGITANPLVGACADALVHAGATALLTEVPEMFGAEDSLLSRAADAHVFEHIVSLINDFKEYFLRHGQPIYENPSPGNRQGGITTLEEKSLGCTQKGGTATVEDVLRYAQRAVRHGLNLVEAPGNDMVSVTALAAAGAHLILFTTGRGTPFGGPVPTLKISTTTELAESKPGWIDFDAGVLLNGARMSDVRDALLDTVLAVASGQRLAANERNGYREIAIFKDGVTL